jgi:hypothetical protein
VKAFLIQQEKMSKVQKLLPAAHAQFTIAIVVGYLSLHYAALSATHCPGIQ